MRNMKKWLLTAFFFLSITTVFAQGKISGIIQDNNGALPGANVVIEGTSTGTSTSFDGSFTLNSTSSKGNVVVSFLGFTSKTIPFTIVDGQADLGTIVLSDEGNVLGEVVITSTIIDVAKDRKTPVAVSTIKAAEIREKLGNQEFPEMLTNTPSVYATKSGGGFGDSRINIRGFDQRNIAVMVNGMPVNDMENSAVYWSNWAGLSDVTSAMQVQRGLGSSKLAISSVGGTINVITRTSDMKQGGSFTATLGNNDYIKTVGSYSTGKMKNGLSASVLLGNAQGSMYADGTQFSAQNYFIGLGYEINEKHNLQFTFTGAPQWHHQRSFANHLGSYIKFGDPVNNEPNIKYNSDWGLYKGEEFSWARNFYHKPVMSLNYDFKINDKTKISSVFYGSWGRGGGTGSIGTSPFRYKTAGGTVPFDDFAAFNRGQYVAANDQIVYGGNLPGTQVAPNAQGQYITNRSLGFTRRASINSHDWYGAVINFNRKLTDKLTLDFGLDGRTYTGYHFRNVNDRLGADGYQANLATTSGGIYLANDVNNPTRTLYETYSASPSFNPFTNVKDQEKIEYNNNGYVRWYGAFTQLEYSTEKLSAFIQGSVSQQGFSREDLFQYKNDDPLQKTDFENYLGGNIKGGLNYNIDEKMNVFANAGYYSKQPNFQAIYRNNKSIAFDNDNEKILGFEVGYGYKSNIFNANFNAYYTSWKDRYQRTSDPDPNNRNGYFEAFGVDEIHKGVELELNVKPFSGLTINGMASYGDWYYNGQSDYQKFDQNNAFLTEGKLLLDKVKVGDVSQFNYSIGANWQIIKGIKVDANYRYSDNLFASIEPGRFSEENTNIKGTLELPSYGLVDAGLSFKIHRTKDSKDSFNFRINVNNLLDKVYIAESRTNQFVASQSEFDGNTGDGKGILQNGSIVASGNLKSATPGEGQYATYQDYLNRGTWNGVDLRNQVFFGFGRTWNLTFRYEF